MRIIKVFIIVGLPVIVLSFRQVLAGPTHFLSSSMILQTIVPVKISEKTSTTNPSTATAPTSVINQTADKLEQAGETAVETITGQLGKFWAQQENIINSIIIFLGIIAACYLVKLIVWLINRFLIYINRSIPLTRDRFSPKRVGTLLSFAGSIAKLFIWIFGIMAILHTFGIDTTTSAGAIGLIGLIMAGMFQQIVIDFVKGLDIIAGRHYSVGDFIEVDGKLGHVIDFNAKYTTLRTLSGQEMSLPNSRCVPSRRFPDGFVNNFIDLTFKASIDQQRVEKIIKPICVDLNQRVEPVRDVPHLAERFNGLQNTVILRYCVQVLPGCDWVIKDYFIPAVKKVLSDEGIELAGEPTFFFINRTETFRKLFSRKLSEQEIISEINQEQPAPPSNSQAESTTHQNSHALYQGDTRNQP